MAFDGVTVAGIVWELNRKLVGGRLTKIAQPEEDELLLTVKQPDGQYRLLLSANASLPFLYLTRANRQSPLTAPVFCMLLRKHLQNGRITGISQPGLERIVHIRIEHLDEMGDRKTKTLIAEIMGKHSNIIFCDEDGTIIDSIKRVSSAVSSLREVLPGRPYFVAHTQEKRDALATDPGTFRDVVSGSPQSVSKAIYGNFTGFSPVLSQELCYRAQVDGEQPTAALDDAGYDRLAQVFSEMAADIRDGRFRPAVAFENGQPVEFAAFPLTMYAEGGCLKEYDSLSALLEDYYAERNALTRIRQKSADLRRVVQTALERNIKKYDLQIRQIQDTEKRETYRIYGELLNTYGYNAAPGAKFLEAMNYYNQETMRIPLDPTLSPTENAKRYFEKYGKLKRTFEALSELTQEVKSQIDHLESIAASLDIAVREEDLAQIREELVESGYLRRKAGSDKHRAVSKPFHYVSSDGFHIYVGKNNYQNDQLTFQFATGNDWWFHAKHMPGSHVIVKLGNEKEMPDRTFEEAARLAAYYSKGRQQEKVEVDYVQKKHVKKPGGAKPGFVVYYTNFSMAIDSNIEGIRRVEEP